MSGISIKTMRKELMKLYGDMKGPPPAVYLATLIIFISSIYSLIGGNLIYPVAALIAIWGIFIKNQPIGFLAIAYIVIDLLMSLFAFNLGFWKTIISLFIAITVYLHISDTE